MEIEKQQQEQQNIIKDSIVAEADTRICEICKVKCITRIYKKGDIYAFLNLPSSQQSFTHPLCPDSINICYYCATYEIDTSMYTPLHLPFTFEIPKAKQS